MKNRILVAAILFFPPGLLLFFWLHPDAVKIPAPQADLNLPPAIQQAAPTNAPASHGVTNPTPGQTRP